MKRKIIKQGHNTLTVTLPSEWVKRFNLLPGAEIDMFERENGLFLSTEKKGENKKTEFNIDGMDIPIIWKYLISAYREGYDELVIRFSPDTKLESPFKFFSQHRYDPKYKKGVEKRPAASVLQGFIGRFIGFEIVEHGKDFVRVKEMGEITSKEFDNSMRRIFLIVLQMAEETLNALKSDDPKSLEFMHDIDINLDKFHDYCIRILNKIRSKESRKTSVLFATLMTLEFIGDEFKHISHHLIYDFPKAKFNKNVGKYAESIKEQLDLYYKLYYSFDKEKVKQLSDVDKETYMGIAKIYSGTTEEEKEILHHLRIVGRHMNTLLELRIEMEF